MTNFARLSRECRGQRAMRPPDRIAAADHLTTDDKHEGHEAMKVCTSAPGKPGGLQGLLGFSSRLCFLHYFMFFMLIVRDDELGAAIAGMSWPARHAPTRPYCRRRSSDHGRQT